MSDFEQLSKLLRYEPDTGEIFWLVDRGPCGNTLKAGTKAGGYTRNKNAQTGYIRITVEGEAYKAHRLVWLLMTGDWPDGHIDHINHDGTDNRFENLRVVSSVENGRNCRRSKANTSGTTGVNWSKLLCRWEAKITVGRRRSRLGFFNDITDAIAARKAAELLHGFHDNHGKVLK